jgi:phage gpG-like protein
MKLKLSVLGLGEAMQRMGDVTKAIIHEARNNALQDLGEKIGEISANKVPLDEGILRSTFTVQKSTTGKLVGYNTEYAAYQHQGVRADGTHIILNRPGGGESFYLTGPVKQNEKALKEFYKERLKKRFNTLK